MDQVAVVLPGAGSSAEFVRRAFGGPLRAAGYALVAPPPVPGTGLVRAAFRALDATAAEHGRRLRLVGGVSLGAHIACRWACRRARCGACQGAAAGGAGAGAVHGRGGRRVELDGVLLALPAWTGTPGPVAAATAASADLVERLGTAGALAAAGTAVEWVAAELAGAWPAYGDGLAASLRAAAAAPGPTVAELASLTVPAGVVAFPDDPLHPAAVAREWVTTIPRAALREIPLAAPAADRSRLGEAALAALAAARAR